MWCERGAEARQTDLPWHGRRIGQRNKNKASVLGVKIPGKELQHLRVFM